MPPPASSARASRSPSPALRWPQVRVDGRLVRTVRVTRAAVVPLVLRPGRHVVRVGYLGSPTTTAASVTRVVRVRR